MNLNQPRQILVTCALPYANGPLHLGHLLEYIQADIWARFQRLQGNLCHFISGEDAHGTPIMLAAEKKGITPEDLIQAITTLHKADLKAFDISLDCFGTTHSPENELYVQKVYQQLAEKGDIITQVVDQAYDTERQLFLPDRYIQGACPKCAALNQYGDNCEKCGATYDALELKDPVSVLTGTTPIAKPSQQYFLVLAHYQEFLIKWLNSDAIPESTKNKLLEWVQSKSGLNNLAISREAPYFGFLIPKTQNKYFYVWIDAPVGYIAIFKQLCKERSSLVFSDYWKDDKKTELYHVIGKDIVKFHAIFWPVMLKAAHFRLPTRLFVHGFLTIDGRKMSKSRGTFITAKHYQDHLPPEYLRYYLASKLNGTAEDIDLNWKDFIQKINADLVGKFVNIASRCARLLEAHCQNQLSKYIESSPLITEFTAAGTFIAEYYEKQHYHHAIRHIMKLADKANHYLDQEKPWRFAKNAYEIPKMQEICTVGLNLFRILSIYLKPVLPNMIKQIEQFLNEADWQWSDHNKLQTDKIIASYQPLASRLTLEQVNALMTDATQHE
jgi:methionyl-tRNA synthetase